MRILALSSCVLFATLAHADECERIPVWGGGRARATVCRADAASRGYTVLDLGEDWTPSPLSLDADGNAPPYRATYLALAQERFGDAALEGELAQADRYLELYGIVPTLGVIGSRLADDTRHACHAAVDAGALAATPTGLTEESAASGRERIARAKAQRAALVAAQNRRKLPDLAALAATSTYHARAIERLTVLEQRIAGIRAVQAHLACDGLLPNAPIDGAYTWQTSTAVTTFQRGALLTPTGRLDGATLEELALGSRERDFRAALRVLRERVIDATGLIEDGTADGGARTVLDRPLAPGAGWLARGHDALPDAAPDLVSPATEAAARALGWLDPESTRKALAARPFEAPRYVAIALPAVPAYHTTAMALSVEIDRGDVSRWQTAKRRPALILYATSGQTRIPLVRWPTTIGGWQHEKVASGEIHKFKDSPVGPRVWRDLFVGPRWLPPDTTPDRELVRTGAHPRLASELLGPSYRAAFGYLAFVHLLVGKNEDDVWDQGIRTHGTGNVRSLADGVSHGCHRLMGLHVVRLAGFVLAHHDHVRRGPASTYYRRVVRHEGRRFPVAIDTLGYRIELVPPIAVEVLRGRVR